MLESYRGTMDDEGGDPRGRPVGDPPNFDWEYGTFLPEVSLVAERGTHMESASLVTLWEGAALIAFTMTHPEARNCGLASAVVAESVDLLRAIGHEEVRLTVTEGNDPAIHVYEKLGFRRIQ
jgi:ribosomal protein S18 acetylase RimI-like enzyme